MSNFLKIGDAVPDLSLPTLDGEQINLQALQGKKSIIFMWASW